MLSRFEGLCRRIQGLELLKSNERLSFDQLLERDQPYQQFHRLISPSNVQIDEKDQKILSRIEGCLIGLAIGDALGAPVEFRPKSYFDKEPVYEMQGGGTWGLSKGQWTDDTSMALCLAASLIVQRGFNGYDQLLRYLRWYRDGYLSSTGMCFDIGNATQMALDQFARRREQKFHQLRQHRKYSEFDTMMIRNIDQQEEMLDCASENSAGNGSLMRLAPIPIYYFDSLEETLKYASSSSRVTHSDRAAMDACQFYAMLIHQAINGVSKNDLLNPEEYDQKFLESLHPDVQSIARGSYKKKEKGYEDGIRGSGYVVSSLEAALWAFDQDKNSFRQGALLAVNLGDDTDTTAAIYGQLAGATYGIERIDENWCQALFQYNFIRSMARELFFVRKSQSLPSFQ